MSFCNIVPRFPPNFDGLGDYCFHLGKHWPVQDVKDERFPGNYLVNFDISKSVDLYPDYRLISFDRSEDSLVKALESSGATTAIVQYSGYGYDNQGAPSWLAKAVSTWKSRKPGRRCVVMFHETYAGAKIWQRAFWATQRQKRCVVDLIRVADVVVTSNNFHARVLVALNGKCNPQIIPIFCCVPFDDSSATKNLKHAVVFGRARLPALKRHLRMLKETIEAGLIERLVLAGECTPEQADAERNFLQSAGLGDKFSTAYNFEKPPEEFLTCGLAIMHTESGYLPKSGVFHLALQLGQVPITIRGLDPGFPLVEKRNYLAYSNSTIEGLLSDLRDRSLLSAISADAKSVAANYFSVSVIADRWHNLISELESSSHSTQGSK